MKWRLKNRPLSAASAELPVPRQEVTGGDQSHDEEASRNALQDDELPVNQGISRFLESCLHEQSSNCVEPPSWTVSPYLSFRDVLGAQPAPPPVLMLNEVDQALRQRVMQVVPSELLDFRRLSTDGASGDEHEVTLAQHLVGLIHDTFTEDHASGAHLVVWRVVENQQPPQADDPDALLAKQRRSLARFKRSTHASVLCNTLAGHCPICLEDLECGQAIRSLPCSHVLHEDCAIGYFKTPGTRVICPICRARVNPTRRVRHHDA